MPGKTCCVWSCAVFSNMSTVYHLMRFLFVCSNGNKEPQSCSISCRLCGSQNPHRPKRKNWWFGVTHVLAMDFFSSKIVEQATMPEKNNLTIYNGIYG